MASVVTAADAPVRMRPGMGFRGLVLAVALIAGLLLMHALTVASSETPHPGGHAVMAKVGGWTASMSASDRGTGEGGVHDGGVCLSSPARYFDVSPAQTEPVGAAPLLAMVAVASREAPTSIDRTNPLSLCVLRR